MAASLLWLVAAAGMAVRASPLDVAPRASSCTVCKPSGATGNPPAVGTDMASLYSDLVTAVNGIHFSSSSRRGDAAALNALGPRAQGFCCNDGSQCVKVDGYNIPMCYDKYTTNFAFADGSTGTINSGAYSAADGSKANLISGNYTSPAGQPGNIYSADQQAQPNTATLSVPAIYTSSGSVSAIPISNLGSVIVLTTTLPPTTLSGPTTLPASTVSVGTSAITTIDAQTISGPTTLAGQTATATVAASATKSKNAANAPAAQAGLSWGMGLVTSLLYFVYAL